MGSEEVSRRDLMDLLEIEDRTALSQSFDRALKAHKDNGTLVGLQQKGSISCPTMQHGWGTPLWNAPIPSRQFQQRDSFLPCRAGRMDGREEQWNGNEDVANRTHKPAIGTSGRRRHLDRKISSGDIWGCARPEVV